MSELPLGAAVLWCGELSTVPPGWEPVKASDDRVIYVQTNVSNVQERCYLIRPTQQSG